MATYRDSAEWKRAMDIVCEIYQATIRFPDEEIFGLTAQMRSTSVRVTSKIAEGAKTEALAALLELEAQIIVAARLGYLIRPIGRRLYKLVRKLEPAVAVLAE